MPDRAVVIGQGAGFDCDRRTPADGLGERQVGIVDVEGDVDTPSPCARRCSAAG
jgi:hypothetical protein